MTRNVMITLQTINEALDESLSRDDSISKLGNDSLEMLYAINQIESKLDIKIPDTQLVKFVTVGNLVDWIVSAP